MNGFRVVLDACVLYPAPLRDLLMELALSGMYKSHWTDAIHDEWVKAVLRERPELSAAIHARADAIVTFNLKDFPNAVMDERGIEAIHPDDFITRDMAIGEPVTPGSRDEVRQYEKQFS